MRTQFPFRVPYNISQGYADNANNYPEGHHGGLDIVPNEPLTDIYAILPGVTTEVTNTDPRRGKGIRVRSHVQPDFAEFLLSKGFLPAGDLGDIYLDTLYWHCHEVTDLDGTIDQDTPIAKEGNTGWVFSGGVQVPDSEKDKSPFIGHHLHLETVLYSTTRGTLNLDKDVRGRIDPAVILQWKKMPLFVIGFGDSGEKWVGVPMDKMNRLQQVLENPTLREDYFITKDEVRFAQKPIIV